MDKCCKISCESLLIVDCKFSNFLDLFAIHPAYPAAVQGFNAGYGFYAMTEVQSFIARMTSAPKSPKTTNPNQEKDDERESEQ